MASLQEQGNTLFKNKSYCEAITLYQRSIEEEEGDKSTTLLNKSLAHSKLGENSPALQSVEVAIALKPNWGKAWCRKALLLSKEHDKNPAVAAILHADNLEQLENNDETKAFVSLRDQLFTEGKPVFLFPLYSNCTPQPVVQPCSPHLPVRSFLRFITLQINKEIAEYYNQSSTDELVEVVAMHPELDIEEIEKLSVSNFLSVGGVFYYKELVRLLDAKILIIDQEGHTTTQTIAAQLPYDQLQQQLLSEKDAQAGIKLILKTTHPLPANNPTVADFHGSGGFAMRISLDIKKLKQEFQQVQDDKKALKSEVEKYKAESSVLRENVTEDQQRKLAELTGDVARLTSENHSLRQRICEMRTSHIAETDALKDMNNQLMGELDDLKSQVALLQSHLAKKDKQAASYQQDMENKFQTLQNNMTQQLYNMQVQMNQLKEQKEADDRTLRLGQVMLLAEQMLRNLHNFAGKLTTALSNQPQLTEQMRPSTNFSWNAAHSKVFKSYVGGRIAIAHQVAAFQKDKQTFQTDINVEIQDPNQRIAATQILDFVFSDPARLQNSLSID